MAVPLARLSSIAALPLSLLLAVSANAQEKAPQAPAAGSDSARYEMREQDGGFVRLDRQTGAMSFCTAGDGNLVCRLGADEREAYERYIANVETRLKEVEDRVDVLEGASGAGVASGKKQDRVTGPAAPGEEGADGPPAGVTPQEEQEFEKAMDFAERAMRRLFGVIRDMRDELQGEAPAN